jgi:hypothetical protein
LDESGCPGGAKGGKKNKKVVTLEARANLVSRKLGVGSIGGWGSNEVHLVVLLSFLNFEIWNFRFKWLCGWGKACKKNKKL